MIVYTVYTAEQWIGEGEEMYLKPEITHLETNSEKEAEAKARELAEKAGENERIYVRFHNTEDINNFGFLNWDGHGVTGKDWA